MTKAAMLSMCLGLDIVNNTDGVSLMVRQALVLQKLNKSDF